MGLGVVDEVPHDQEVSRVAHVGDDLELVVQALVLLLGRLGVALPEAVLAERAQVLVGSQVPGHLVARQEHATKLDGKVAHHRHLGGVADRLLDLGKTLRISSAFLR